MTDLTSNNFQQGCFASEHSTDGLEGPGVVPWDPINWPCMAALFGICYMVSLELLFRVIFTLRNIRGLYFWSLIAGASGCIIHISGSLLKFFVDGTSWQLSTAIIVCGWWCMIVGQSLVLYSRLYLVVDKKIVIWGIRIMIGFTFVAFLIPGPATTILINQTDGMDPGINTAWEGMERAQLFGFLASECTLSIIYMIASANVLRTNAVMRVKNVVRFLIVTNLLIIALDGIVFAMQVLDWYAIQATLKPCVYAVKLKLEFAFLNQLFYITKHGFEFVRDPRKRPAHNIQLKDLSTPGQTEQDTPANDITEESEKGLGANQSPDDTPEGLLRARNRTNNLPALFTGTGMGSDRTSARASLSPTSLQAFARRHFTYDVQADAADGRNAEDDEGTGIDQRIRSPPEPAATFGRLNLARLERRLSAERFSQSHNHLRRAEMGLRDFT